MIERNMPKPYWLDIAIIFLVAFMIRLAYIYQLSHTQFFVPLAGGLDDYIYDNLAREILKGNWFGDGKIYIYRMPLYEYFLAAVYFIFKQSYWAVYIIQSLIGSASCILVYFIGKNIFNRATGLTAGLINALCATALFYNGMLVGETIGIFLACATVALLLLFQKRQGYPSIFMAGICMGLLMMVRGSMMMLLIFLLIWIFMFFKNVSFVKPAKYAALFIVGIALAISPVMLRNYLHERDVIPIVAQGGMQFYIGNAYGADGKYRDLDIVGSDPKTMPYMVTEIAQKAMGRSLKPSEVSSYWFREAMKSIDAHGITFIFPLMLKKIALFWNSYELPDIWDYYFFKNHIPLLRFPFFTFLTVMPLGFVGIYISWKKRRELWPLYIFIFGYMISLLLAFITSRYRFYIFPFLSIFAAYGICEIKDILKDDETRLSICLAILVLALAFSNIDIGKTSPSAAYNSFAVLLKRSGKINEAIGEYKKAIEADPTYAPAYYNLGLLYEDAGDRKLAAEYFKKTLQLAPHYDPARKRLEAL